MLARRADELRTAGRAPRLADLGRLVGRDRRGPSGSPGQPASSSTPVTSGQAAAPAPGTVAVRPDGGVAPMNGRPPADVEGPPVERVPETTPTARIPR